MTERNLQPWERRDDGVLPAWEAFRMYRDLGPAIRSTGQVQERIGKSRRLIDKWCSKYSWVERTREYDRSADAEQVDEYRQQVRRIVHQQTDLADKLLRHLDTTLDSMIVRARTPPSGGPPLLLRPLRCRAGRWTWSVRRRTGPPTRWPLSNASSPT